MKRCYCKVQHLIILNTLKIQILDKNHVVKPAKIKKQFLPFGSLVIAGCYQIFVFNIIKNDNLESNLNSFLDQSLLKNIKFEKIKEMKKLSKN